MMVMMMMMMMMMMMTTTLVYSIAVMFGSLGLVVAKKLHSNFCFCA